MIHNMLIFNSINSFVVCFTKRQKNYHPIYRNKIACFCPTNSHSPEDIRFTMIETKKVKAKFHSLQPPNLYILKKYTIYTCPVFGGTLAQSFRE